MSAPRVQVSPPSADVASRSGVRLFGESLKAATSVLLGRLTMSICTITLSPQQPVVRMQSNSSQLCGLAGHEHSLAVGQVISADCIDASWQAACWRALLSGAAPISTSAQSSHLQQQAVEGGSPGCWGWAGCC